MLYTIGPCPNCKDNLWKRDYQHRRLKRYECFYCGADLYLNRPAPGILRAMYADEADLPTRPEITE
jgi:hypothetical protein